MKSILAMIAILLCSSAMASDGCEKLPLKLDKFKFCAAKYPQCFAHYDDSDYVKSCILYSQQIEQKHKLEDEIGIVHAKGWFQGVDSHQVPGNFEGPGGAGGAVAIGAVIGIVAEEVHSQKTSTKKDD